jgi:SAM-dependent methyltransferase/uncharacterized protein YbaR (Trm112 family)
MQLETCDVLCCPACRGTLDPGSFTGGSLEEGALTCSSCHVEYPVHGGIPIFLRDHLLAESTGEGFSALSEDSRQKVLQREWHDRAHVDREYKRAAYGSRTLFSYLLYYQMLQVEELLAQDLYSRVANICAGHGFELEFLSKFSSNILAVDISWNSLRRALNRSRELGLNVEAICADAENLPLRSSSFDLVFTHHSLHHLPRPMRGLEEMLRISRHRVALFEPAKGLTRTVMTRLGIKPEVEEAGNFVYEFDPKNVEALCSNEHALVRYFRKCLIAGPADEPPWFRRLDKRHITPLLCGTISIGNYILGNSLGTKCGFILEKYMQRAEAPSVSSGPTLGDGKRESSRFSHEVQPAKQ